MTREVAPAPAEFGLEPRGQYFEDFAVGQKYHTPRRTVTQTDIINYACLSGDFLPPHVDFEFCKTQPYGEPIAHGPLVLAIAAGLIARSGMSDGTVIAMLGMDEWRIHSPVKHGDTLRVTHTVLHTRLASKRDRGVVTFAREIVNQRDEIVQSMKVTSLYRCRDA